VWGLCVGYLLELQEFMENQFNGLQLSKPLFYQANIGLRFELGADLEIEKSRMEQVYARAHALFDFTHSPTDEVFLVVNAHRYNGREEKYDAITTVFECFVPEINLRENIDHIRLPALYFDETDEEYEDVWTDRYCLRCTVTDIQVHELLDAIANWDMVIEPRVDHECYFVNVNRGTIFHLYDDRGLDIVANRKASLYEVYTKYNEWILNYDRERIHGIFSV